MFGGHCWLAGLHADMEGREGSPSLPPASQPATPPTSYQNRTPLIARGIDPKFKTPIQIMSELRQYHHSLRVFQIRQSSKGWIFMGDTPKDFAILQTQALHGLATKCKLINMDELINKSTNDYVTLLPCENIANVNNKG